MAVFEASGSSDPTGLWDTTPQILSFGIGDETAAEDAAPVFRVNLPPGLAAANQALAEQRAGFERMNAALAEIPGQLDRLARRRNPKNAPVAFDVEDAAPESGLENELLALLADADSAALSASAQPGVSFGVNEVVSEAFGKAMQKFEALLKQVNHEMLHFAWAETRLAGQTIARTRVGWSGDSTTLLNGLTRAEQALLHQQTLEIVSQTRHLKLRMLLTISSGAAKVAVLMASPGGPMLALPAVCQYVMKILEQTKQIQSLQSSLGEKKPASPEAKQD